MAQTHAPSPSRGAGPPGARRLAAAMAARSREASERWLEALDRYLHVPRRELFPEGVGADVHAVVAWIIGAERGRIPEEVLSVMRSLVNLRESQGRLVGDLHREFHLLSRILHEVLEEEAEAAAGSVRPADVAVEAGRLSRALLTAVGVATDMFEERQRTERDEAFASFASAVRHELRNPLGAAQAAAQLLREDGDALGPERHERVLRSLDRSVRQAVEMLSSVTALGRERPPGEVERWEPLPDLLHRVTRRVADLVDDDVDIDVAEGLPALRVDADRFEILIHNLVENAVKYRHRGRERSWVRLDVDRDQERHSWWVHVSDNGVGIEPDEQERIFRRFYRATSDHVDGTGLGLSIAGEAARQMGGSIQVRSTPGEGSVFSVRIPDDRTRPAA